MHVIKVFDLDKTITRADTFIPFLITWYLKNTINIQGIGDIESIIPYELTDSLPLFG
jgi:hypothetical protein